MKKAVFKVRIDRMGSMRIACHSGSEVTETGVRGLNTLVHSGLMRAPGAIHVDPMHRHVEIDGIRFDCDEAGARAFECALNERYASAMDEKPAVIKVRENPASPTGFDLEYLTERDGVRRDVIVQLAQDELDLLQDAGRCGLINPRVAIRLNPPYLTARQKHPEGTETPIPGLVDIGYRSATAAMIQHLLNHPAVLRGGAGEEPAAKPARPCYREMRVVRHSNDKMLLWLECFPLDGSKPVLRALTHQNMMSLQHDGVFLENLDVNLSLDNRRLGVLDRAHDVEQSIVVEVGSPEEDLQTAGRLLTASLRLSEKVAECASTEAPASATPPAPRADAAPASMPAAPVPQPRAAEPAIKTEPPRQAAPVPEDVAELFAETDPLRINQLIFEELAADVDIPVRDVRLSLPRIFENRRFRILNFEDKDVSNVMELRGEDFYGFYLAELPHDGLDLVYACRGVHIEWGVGKCVLQPALRSEPAEFRGCGLIGLAQDGGNAFLFIVSDACKEWVKPHLGNCAEANARFATLGEYAEKRGECTLIWPTAVVAEPA